MIKTYGLLITADHPQFGRVVKRREVPAESKAEAVGYARGWCILQGYGIGPDSFRVETEGMTYRERMTRALHDAGARLSLAYGATVVGPWEWGPRYEGDAPRSIMRLVLPNGWGVSLSSRLSDAFSVDTNMVTGHPTGADGWECEFPCPDVLAYDTGVSLEPEDDPKIGKILAALAKLPTHM